MRDLTRGAILRHILTMAAPISVGMFVQTMHYLVDLYFVARIGGVALAGVSTAGILFFLVFEDVPEVAASGGRPAPARDT